MGHPMARQLRNEWQDEAQTGLQLGKMLGVPAHLLAEKRVQYALFMIIFSSRVTRERTIEPAFCEKLGPLAPKLIQNYFKIYFENSSKKRLLFFCDPLIQYLWGIFRDESVSLHKSYMQQVRHQIYGAEKIYKLMKDVAMLQEALNFQVFP